MTWTKPSEKTHPLLKLAELATRMQRLVLLERIRTVNSLIAMHTPKLQQHPRGKEVLAEAKQHSDKLMAMLRPHKERDHAE